jgi:hypothetical protein
MASTNFLVFDEGKQNMMSDGDYSANTQRARGVTPGIAYPNLHNKLYYQVSVMAKAIADFMVAQGANASDGDVEQLTADISTAFTNFVDNKTKDVYLPLSGGTMKGNINANGYNITATKFIGNLQGKADSAANADLATKATQDSQGQAINTTYIKSITASNATLTVTKGNGTTSTVTINNVAHATKADDATNAGNINKGYAEYAEKFPADTFRNDVLGREGNGFALRPFYCLLPNGKYGSSPGVGFGSIDTQGFLQVAYNAPIAYVGAGNEGKIKWSKQLAFTDSPTLTGTPTAPTQNTSDNSTRIATTAFVKSLFTASKATNGWWKDGNTGIIYQWGVNNINSTSKSFNFNISFPNSCFIVRAGDIGIGARSVGSKVKDNASFTIYTDDSSKLVFSWFAVGY